MPAEVVFEEVVVAAAAAAAVAGEDGVLAALTAALPGAGVESL